MSTAVADPARLDLIRVKSSALDAIGYDEQRRILAVRFTSGAIINYGSVAPETVQAMLEAESIGSFYAKNIKGKYPGEKMTGQCGVCRAHGWKGDYCEAGCAWEGESCVYMLEERHVG